eukprot:4714161-Amphidinium_carterae.2
MKIYVPKKGRSNMYARPVGSPRVMHQPSSYLHVRTAHQEGICSSSARHAAETNLIKPTVTVQKAMLSLWGKVWKWWPVLE